MDVTWEQFFGPRTEPEGDCIVWTKCLSGGYGAITIAQQRKVAHRYSWELSRGPIPDGLWVLHHCDNRRCVNPDHLFLGNAQDNVDDMHAKRREKRSVPVEDYPKIAARWLAGESQQSIANDYGCDRTTIAWIFAKRLHIKKPLRTHCKLHENIAIRRTRSGKRYCPACVTERGRRNREVAA